MPAETGALTIVLAVFTGLGLAAACGLRVFLPLLLLAIAVRAEALTAAEGFEWLGGTPALVVLGVATVLEIAAFTVPWLDNALDVIATPAAGLAGALAATSVLVGLDPWLAWSLGIIAGGGVATLVHVPTAAARATSTATTGGALNPAVATGEVASAGIVSGLSIFAPVVVPLLVIGLVASAVRMWRKGRGR